MGLYSKNTASFNVSTKNSLKYRWLNDTLNLELKIKNISNKNLYIPLRNWDIEGNEENNYWLNWVPIPGVINQITFVPANYYDIKYKFGCGYAFPNIPKYLKIKPKEELILHIHLANFANNYKINKSYRFFVVLSCIDDIAFNDISEFTKIPITELNLKDWKQNFVFTFLCQEKKLSQFYTQKYWTSTNDDVNDALYTVKYKFSDKFKEELQAYINEKYIRFNKVLYIKKN